MYRNESSDNVEFMLGIRKSIVLKAGEFNNLPRVSEGVMQTPQYALVLRAALDYDNRTFTSGESYMNRPEKNNLSEIKKPEVRLFRSALNPTNKTPQNDLFVALGYASLGDPYWGENIIAKKYLEMSEIQEKVKVWKEKHNYSPYSNENMHLLAYISQTLKKQKKVVNPALTEIVLNSITDFSNGEGDYEKARIFHNHLAESFREKGLTPDYTLRFANNNTSPPFEIYNLRNNKLY